MITLGEILKESKTTAEQPRVTAIREPVSRKPVSRAVSVHDEQIQALVQQLFFQHESKPVRHLGFAPIEISTTTANLCLEVATALAEEGRYDVGLIDAHTDSAPLPTQLQIPSPIRAGAPWPIAPRLWMVPRQSWRPDADRHRLTEQNLSRLRDLTTEFDFSILWCAPVSWLTASIAQACDGLVLVLSANKTRRLVASQIKDELSRAQVPVLGVVLAGRSFPVPQGLYRSL